MSNNIDRDLVERLASEVVDDSVFSLRSNSKTVSAEFRFCFYEGEKPLRTLADLNKVAEEIRVASLEKAKRLRPESLGRVIAIGVDDPAFGKRTTMSMVIPVNALLESGKNNGRTMLQKLASLVIAAAAWDILINEMFETNLADKEVKSLFSRK